MKKPTPRFFAPNLAVGEVALPEDQSHHARSVRRLSPADAVELFDGRGNFAAGEIIQLGRRETVVRVDEIVACNEPMPRVHLGFAVPKGKRLDWLLEKATELGVRSLWPVVFERSVAAGGKPDRWESHCISAAKQCRLNWLPEVHELMGLGEFLAADRPEPELKIVGDLQENAGSLREVFDGAGRGGEDVVLLVGPEGGFTEDERSKIAAAGFLPVQLGSATLRIETAGVALLAGVRAM